MTRIHEQTAWQLHGLMESRQVSCREVVQSSLDRIQQVDGGLHAFVHLTPKSALEQADAVDRRLAAGEQIGPLEGIPLAMKDILCTRGEPTTCCSKILAGYRPPYDATVVRKLREAGTIMMGKTNMDEFAMGSSTENSAYGPTRNPWDRERVPGGSSGGSAAAVSSGECPISTGTDTGGSIRQPAAFCGVVGLKPTYGRVSRYGLIAFASSLDQVGPITGDVRDCALMLQAISGHDPMDSTSVPAPAPDYQASLAPEVTGLRIGVVDEFFEYQGARVQPEIEQMVRAGISALEEMGAVAEPVSLPNLQYIIPVYYLIAPAEASSNLARYDGVQYGHRSIRAGDVVEMYRRTRDEGFGPEVKRRIMLGTYALSAGYYDAYYLKASQVRTLIKRDFDRAFERFDLLIGPTTPTTAFRLGEKVADPLAMYLSDVCTIPANLAGLPAISVPCGLAGGLPVGLQMVGRPLDEPTLLRAAYALEQSRPPVRPPL